VLDDVANTPGLPATQFRSTVRSQEGEFVQYEADGVYPRWEPTIFSRPDGRPVDTLACDDSPGALGNNLGEIEVSIPPPGEGIVTAPCTRGEIGPKRECGFDYRGAFACTPGEPIVLDSVAVGGLLSPQLRVCESSSVLGGGVACTWRSAVATASGAAIGFTCPEVRDSLGSGAYSLYVGDVVGRGPVPFASVAE
jgi:hypothetical protein